MKSITEQLNSKKNYLFFGAYIFYVSSLMFNSSAYISYPQVNALISLGIKFAFLLIVLKVLTDFFTGEYKVKEFMFFCFGSAVLLFIYINSHEGTPIVIWTFIWGAKNVNPEIMAKLAFIVMTCCFLIILFSCFAGIVENKVFIRSNGENRYSIGFDYATNPANYFFAITLIYVYLRKDNFSLIEAIVIIGISLIFFIITDTKWAFVCTVIASLGAILLKLLRDSILVKIFQKLTIISVPICAACISILVFIYQKVNYPVIHKTNELLSGRLRLALNAINNFGFSWWGKSIIWSTWYAEGVEYNYVDSSYLQLLLNHGIIFFIILICFFVSFAYKAYKKSNKWLLFVLALTAIHSIFDPQILWLDYNPFLLMYFGI